MVYVTIAIVTGTVGLGLCIYGWKFEHRETYQWAFVVSGLLDITVSGVLLTIALNATK
ncbi:MAG: hypothetical protein U0Z75_08110 [Deinococcaceae bacterium]